MDSGVKYALVIAGIILALIVLSKFTFKPRSAGPNADQCRKLVDESKHWHATAQQDSNIVMALVHITTALAKMNTLFGIVSPADAMRLTHVDVEMLKKKIQAYHNKVIAGFEEAAPHLALPAGTQCDLDWYIASTEGHR